MSPDDVTALAEAFKAAVQDAFDAAPPLPPKMLFTAQEAHEITGLPVTFFEREGSHGSIPSRLIESSGGGTYRRWSLDDLEEIVAAYEVQPTSGLMARLRERDRAAKRRSPGRLRVAQ